MRAVLPPGGRLGKDGRRYKQPQVDQAVSPSCASKTVPEGHAAYPLCDHICGASAAESPRTPRFFTSSCLKDKWKEQHTHTHKLDCSQEEADKMTRFGCSVIKV